MSKKKYANAAEKQKAWRIRHGQLRKVPLELRRGERLGAQEADLRDKKSEESWSDYHKYLLSAVGKARTRQKSDVVSQKDKDENGDSKRARRSVGGYKEPQFSEDYYEIRRKYESDLEALMKKQKGGKIKK